MEKILTDLAEALRERLAIIADEDGRRDPARHTERLRQVSERIEQIEQTLPPTIDPQLRHFLKRRSYTKALELLEEADAVTRSRGVEEEVLDKLDEPAPQ